MDKEIWKDIVGYDGLYKISNNGRVKSLGRVLLKSNGRKQAITERVLKPAKRGGGYFFVYLYLRGSRRAYGIHRIVAFMFLLNPQNKPQVNHINGIKTDNRLCNLEWVSAKENIKHARDIGLINNTGENHALAKLNNKDVLEIRKLISEKTSGVAIAKKFNISKSTISCIKTGRLWSSIKLK